MEEKPTFPMRINKYLSMRKLATRRGADELISKKKVYINGKPAVLGDKVNENDKIEVLHARNPQPIVYLAYHKPIGVITHSPQKGEVDIKESAMLKHVFPIGRLDKNSHGLIILTNDGRITDRMLNPKFEHEKEYVVQTSNKLRTSFQKNMEKGVDIEGYMTKKCKVKIIDDHTFSIVLTEGKKHQIRRMCSNLFQEVSDLKRTRVMSIELGKLAPNSYRKIEGGELEIFLKELDM